ncbi:hypothetical protein DIPPA_18867 [Diplonema papillatum]|nr:hypothetical protein DIPPA_18867 [Diplonema papillatum]
MVALLDGLMEDCARELGGLAALAAAGAREAVILAAARAAGEAADSFRRQRRAVEGQAAAGQTSLWRAVLTLHAATVAAAETGTPTVS